MVLKYSMPRLMVSPITHGEDCINSGSILLKLVPDGNTDYNMGPVDPEVEPNTLYLRIHFLPDTLYIRCAEYGGKEMKVERSPKRTEHLTGE